MSGPQGGPPRGRACSVGLVAWIACVLGCAPPVQRVVPLDRETCEPDLRREMRAGIFDFDFVSRSVERPAGYVATVWLGGAAPPMVQVFVEEPGPRRSGDMAEGGDDRRSVAGVPSRTSPRTVPVKDLGWGPDGASIVELELLTTDDLENLDMGAIGARTDRDTETTLAVAIEMGGPTTYFPIVFCRGCLEPQPPCDFLVERVDFTCRYGQDQPAHCVLRD